MSIWAPQELAYCSNVHPGDSLQAVRDNIATYISEVRLQRNLSSQHAGLWLSKVAADELADPAVCRDFSNFLVEHGIVLSSLNGFPYGNFHSDVVKEAVYNPHWGEQDRLEYTLQLARILARCMPEDGSEGAISTLPLGFSGDWSHTAQARAEQHLGQLLVGLQQLEETTGKHIRVCLEMEPGCVLESTAQLIDFFTHILPAAISRKGLDRSLITRHLGVCYDVCHQAVMFEDIEQSLSSIIGAGIVIGKIQISSALQVVDPTQAQQLLAQYAEPRYLHQVSAQDTKGTLYQGLDLEHALNGCSPLPLDAQWRIHFHVPIQAQQLSSTMLTTTRDAIEQTCHFLAARPQLHPKLEVETYTWEVMPEQLRPQGKLQLIHGLVIELAWLEKTMRVSGLLG